jgi:hypothetical protein
MHVPFIKTPLPLPLSFIAKDNAIVEEIIVVQETVVVQEIVITIEGPPLFKKTNVTQENTIDFQDFAKNSISQEITTLILKPWTSMGPPFLTP